MSIAIGHFAFGAAMTTLLVTFLLPTIRYPRTVILAGGGWAMLPDFHQVSPVAAEQLRGIHQNSVWTDVFWLHRSMDRLDPADSNSVAAAVLAGLIVATLVSERRDYQATESVEAVYDSLLETDSD